MIANSAYWCRDVARLQRKFTGSDLAARADDWPTLIALAIDRFRFEAEAEVIRHAEQAESLRSEVMATLSHELRTPLAAIKGYATALLLEEVTWPEEKRREFLHRIDDECENLQAMITDILDSSLIDAGQLALERQPVRLSRLAREIADEMQRRSETHRLLVDIPPDSPIVDVDPRRITQVFGTSPTTPSSIRPKAVCDDRAVARPTW